MPQVSDNALRVIMQKLDSITSTLKDTQMRVQKLEEDKVTASLQAVPLPNPIQDGELADRPWQMRPERKVSEEERSVDTSRVAPERHGIRAIPFWKTYESLSRETRKVPFQLATTQDYGFWKFSMLKFLKREGLAPFIDGSTPIPLFPELEDEEAERLYFRWLEFDNATQATILASVTKTQGARLTQCTNAREMWLRLQNIHMHDSEVNVARMREELLNVTWKRNSSVDEYIQEVDRLADNLISCGEQVQDKDLKMILMKGLPDRLETVKLILLQAGKLMNYPTLCDNLRSQVGMTNSRQDSKAYMGTGENSSNQKPTPTNYYSESSQQSGSQKPTKTCNFCKMSGHLEESCYKKKNLQVCTKCNKKGHKATECRGGKAYKDPRTMLASTSNLKQQGGNTAKSNTQKLSGLMAHTEVNEEWIIDSGASQHMCNNPELFEPQTQVEVINQNVHMGNGSTSTAHFKGSIPVNLTGENGHTTPVVLKEVLGVPGLSKNLFSVTACLNNGFYVLFKSDPRECRILEASAIVATGFQSEGLWVLKTEEAQHSALISVRKPNGNQPSLNPNRSNLLKWHQKFGHLHLEGLLALERKKMVTGLEDLQDTGGKLECEVCDSAKMAKLPFPKTRQGPRSSEVLELVHSDIVGPITPSTVRGAKYILTFIDDRSHYCWSYLLSHKDDTFATFLEWKALAERSTGKKLKKLRTDNGGEYSNHKFQDLCKNEGITHQKSIPHTPEQNGVAERWNRTLLDTARAMLEGAPGVSTSLWGEAVAAATHVRNRCPTRGIPEDKTPTEVCYGKTPIVNYFKVWGSKVSVMTPQKDRKKFDPRSAQGIFVGYGVNQKGYRIYNPVTKSVQVSRNLVFHATPTFEDGVWQREEDQEELHGWPDNFSTPESEFGITDLHQTENSDTAEQGLPTTVIRQANLNTTDPEFVIPDRTETSSESYREEETSTPRNRGNLITADRSSVQSRGGRKSKLDGKVNIGGSRKTPNPGPRTDRSNSTSTNQDESESARPIANETDKRAHRNSPKTNSTQNSLNSNSLNVQNSPQVEEDPNTSSAHILHDERVHPTNRDVNPTPPISNLRDEGMSNPSTNATQNLRRSSREHRQPVVFNYVNPGEPDNNAKHYMGFLATTEDHLTYKKAVSGN